MKSLRGKLFILSYLGNLLLILATFVPIIKFNNQSFSFIDQFFYLSFAIVVLSTISLICITIKKYKLSLIPTIINAGVIAYGVYKIFHIENLNMLNYSKEIALIIYPVGVVIAVLGSLLVKLDNDNGEKNGISRKEQNIEQFNEHTNVMEENNLDLNDDLNTNLNYEEQIPLTMITNKNSIEINDSENKEKDEKLNIEYNGIDSSNELDENSSKKNILDVEYNGIDSSNKLDEDSLKKNILNIDKLSENKLDENNIINNSNDFNLNTDVDDFIAEEELLEEIDEIPTEQLIANANNFSIDDDELFMDDVNDNNIIPQEITILGINDDSEIPDLDNNGEDLMKNNTQAEDAPKKEFMALNPSDIKIDDKKSLFKRKDKKEDVEDPIEKIMKRDIPTTLGRKCQFCETPLGDDERICPICGRIN